MEINKALKLVSKDRRTKKGVAIRDLDDLTQKGIDCYIIFPDCCGLNKLCFYVAKRYFEISPNETLKLVLEEDGTEIVEDAYLLLQPDNTQIMVLKPGEEWVAKPFTIDVTDHSRRHDIEHYSFDAMSTLKNLAKNPSSILLLNERELEVLAQFDTSQDIGIPNTTLEFLVEKCEEELEQKRSVKDAISLVHLYQKATENSQKDS